MDPDEFRPEGAAAPVARAERLIHIDVIRGLALLGVLVMNMHFWFRAPMMRYSGIPHPWPGLLNKATDWALALFVSGKAMSSFAMLFAVGLAIQMERALGRGFAFRGYAFRRLGALFLFGVLHIVLVWNGDILHQYALVGLVLLVFLNRRRKTVLIWLGSLWVLSLGAMLVYCIIQLRGPAPLLDNTKEVAKRAALLAETLRVRGGTSWMAELQFRLKEWTRIFFPLGEVFGDLYCLMQFLLGLAIWKSGVLENPGVHLRAIRKVAGWCITLGLSFELISVLSTDLNRWFTLHWAVTKYALPLIGITQLLGPPLLALGLCAGVLMLWQTRSWKRVLAPFALAGRMAFTSYLTQSVIMNLLFDGWGFGLYNRLGPFAGLLVACFFFTLQVAFSHWWLARFAFGPLEWVWRSITYGRLQPMRRRQPVPGGLPATV